MWLNQQGSSIFLITGGGSLLPTLENASSKHSKPFSVDHSTLRSFWVEASLLLFVQELLITACFPFTLPCLRLCSRWSNIHPLQVTFGPSPPTHTPTYLSPHDKRYITLHQWHADLWMFAGCFTWDCLSPYLRGDFPTFSDRVFSPFKSLECLVRSLLTKCCDKMQIHP